MSKVPLLYKLYNCFIININTEGTLYLLISSTENYYLRILSKQRDKL